MYSSPFYVNFTDVPITLFFLESIDLEYLLGSPDALLWQCSKKKKCKLPHQLCLVHYYILTIIETMSRSSHNYRVVLIAPSTGDGTLQALTY